eukprot:516575_1
MKIIKSWKCLDESLYQSELSHILKDKFGHTELNHSKLAKLIKAINLYTETKEFIEWISNNKDVNNNEFIMLYNFEFEMQQIQANIQSIIQFSSDINKLLDNVASFDERTIFDTFGEYIENAFDISVNKMIQLLKNNVFPFLINEYHEKKQQNPLQQYENNIMHYFITQNIKGNKLKSVGKKQFEISLINWIDKNKSDATLSHYLGRLYDRLLNQLSVEAGDDNKHNDNNDIKLFYTNSDEILNTVIKLFSSQNQILNASHILICSQYTTFEEVNCLLYSFQNDKQNSLYCLVQPEKLHNDIRIEVLSILLNQKINSNATVVVITSDRKSKWYSALKMYQQNTIQPTNVELVKFYNEHLCTNFDEFKSDKVSNDNPFCMVFSSNDPCVGKSHQITKMCKENNLIMIHIPFNTLQIDEDFVVDRLVTSQEYTEQNEKIVFHCNISSYCGKNINYLLFFQIWLSHMCRVWR